MTAFVGRLQERQLLRAALEDRAPSLVVVRGPSGVGKTALVDQVLYDLLPTGPILGRAKYAEQTTNAGLGPVVDALSQAVDAALGRLYDPAAGAASLRALVGAQFDTLLAAGFRTSGLVGSAAPSNDATLRSRDGTMRLIDALVRVLQWLEGFALPVVLFVDDWHRAPNEAVGFVHACSHRGDGSALKLVLGARDEDKMAYPKSASIISVQPLGNAQQLDLLTGLLSDPAKAQAVLDWLGDHTSGLPFDLAEIALALDREDAFAGSGPSLSVDPARATSIDYRDINMIIVQRARKLPPEVMRFGIAAALWGDRAGLDVLGGCLAQSRAATLSAAETLQANGLLRVEGDEIVFLHDRVRASLLQAPHSEELRGLAHVMADALLGESSDNHRRTALRLKLLGGIDDVGEARLAAMFAAEAAPARLAVQFDLAAAFGEAAWSIFQRLRGSEPADRFAVLREASFAAAHRRQADATRERCTLMIAAAANDAELAEAYERSINAMRLAGTSADAWTFCREGFARFGIRLPDHINQLRLVLATFVWRLVGRKARRLIRRDARTEQALASLIDAASFTVFERSLRHSAYVAVQASTRARLRGENSPQWLSVDALIYAIQNDYRKAAELGERALAGAAQMQTSRGMTIHCAVYFGTVWRDPRASLVARHRQIYDLFIAEGNLVMAANATVNELSWTWRSAPTLEEVVAKLEEADGKAKRLDDARIGAAVALLTGVVGRLQRPEPLSHELPDAFAQDKIDELPVITALEYWSLAEDWPAILRMVDQLRGKRFALHSHPNGVSGRFYETLARLKTGLFPNRWDLRFIERAAGANPTDHLGKLLLLRAEHGYRRGKKDSLRAYASAVEAMQKGSSRLELGLAAECAAAAAQALGDRAAHERFHATAIATWSDWGAFAKLAVYRSAQFDAPIQARLAQAEARTAMAQRGERAKSRFLAEVGHELRTPLQAMQGLLDLAAERPDEINLGEIREVFGSLKSVVDDLTELGAQGADAPLNIRTTDLAALVSSELRLVQEVARQKGLTLDSNLVPLHDRFFGVDPDRVRQVVRNLMSNAVKYTSTGGIRVRASVSDSPDDRVHVTLAVEDSGPGIPEEHLPHIFEPFDRAGRKDSNGLGLGLALSRRIAERMGGSLAAENRKPGGSQFVFSFAAIRRDAPVGPPLSSRPLTILIVEDTQLVRRLMARLLEIDGHEVIQAENLARGLELVSRHRLDLLLLDLHLPDGDGLSLLEQWPEDRERPPVIALTAAVTRETEGRVSSAGATVLHKPIAAADLRAAIAQVCGGLEVSKTPNGFDTEMAKLAADAREEIARRTAELADLVRSDKPRAEIQYHAHKLAGLAAQFDAPYIAEAADRIGQACRNGRVPEDYLVALKLF